MDVKKSPIRNVVFDLGGVMINYNPRLFTERLGYDMETGDKLCDAISRDPIWTDMDLGKYMTYTEALDVFVSRHPSSGNGDKAFFLNPAGWKSTR